MKKEVTLIDIDATLTGVQELLTHVVNHMATKEDVANIRAEMTEEFADVRAEMATKKDLADGLESIRTEMSAGFASVRSEISEVKQQLKDLEETVESHSGFAKEIDHNLARTVAIERHLGLAVT